MPSTFQMARAVLDKHGIIIHEKTLDIWRDPTLVVLGERHFHPEIQQEVFQLLAALQEHVGIGVFCIEGSEQTLARAAVVDLFSPGRYLKDTDYVQKFLAEPNRVGALSLFAWWHRGVFPTYPVDDMGLRKISGPLDEECFALFQERGFADEVFQAKLQKLLDVCLRQRSTAMVRNAVAHLYEHKVPLGVLLVGAGHTPVLDAYMPFSVIAGLHEHRINSIVAVGPKTQESFLRYERAGRHPYDFWTPLDETEQSPYA